MKIILFLISLVLARPLFAGDFVVYPFSYTSNVCSTFNFCPSNYCSYTEYRKWPTNGFGWAPDTNVTVHSATYTNQPNVVVQFVGKNGDVGCGSPTATTGNPASSRKYRFAIYWPTGSTVPTRTIVCPLTLTGFLP